MSTVPGVVTPSPLPGTAFCDRRFDVKPCATLSELEAAIASRTERYHRASSEQAFTGQGAVSLLIPSSTQIRNFFVLFFLSASALGFVSEPDVSPQSAFGTRRFDRWGSQGYGDSESRNPVHSVHCLKFRTKSVHNMTTKITENTI